MEQLLVEQRAAGEEASVKVKHWVWIAAISLGSVFAEENDGKREVVTSLPKVGEEWVFEQTITFQDTGKNGPTLQLRYQIVAVKNGEVTYELTKVFAQGDRRRVAADTKRRVFVPKAPRPIQESETRRPDATLELAGRRFRCRVVESTALNQSTRWEPLTPGGKLAFPGHVKNVQDHPDVEFSMELIEIREPK